MTKRTNKPREKRINTVARELRKKIWLGILKPGQKLSERNLCEHLNVKSRSQVRSALALLEHEGLVEVLLSGTAAVTTLEESDVEEIFEARQAIETVVVSKLANMAGQTSRSTEHSSNERLAAMPPAFLRAIQCNSKIQSLNSDNVLNDNWEFAHLDADFHRLLAEAGGFEKTLAKFLRDLRYRFFVRARLDNYEVVENTANEHQAIYNAILLGDQTQAATALRAHLQNGLKRWKELAADLEITAET